MFPEFKRLEITDKDAVAKYTNHHKPYSDFGFTSIFSWDTSQDVEISTLNSNLVLKFSDYLDGTKFLTFLGDNKPDETALKLLDYAKLNGYVHELRLIPKTVVDSFTHPRKFIINEDRDNFDYILAVEDQEKLPGKLHAKRRYVLNRFQSLYGKNLKVIPLDISDKKIQDDIIKVFETWEKSMSKDRAETQNELTAIKRVLQHAKHLDVQVLGVMVNDILAGFSIYEIVQNNHGVIHFEKADVSFQGIFQYLKYVAARELSSKKQTFINIEQDLGLEGLRESKLTHHPVHFLKKYTVSLKNPKAKS